MATDRFGPLTSVRTAQVVREAWSAAAPHVEIVDLPQSDGAPGFAEAVGGAGGAHPELPTTGDTLPAHPAWVRDGVAVVDGPDHAESADAPDAADAIGQQVRRLLDDGARRVVLGSGPGWPIDGGRAFLRGLTGVDDAAAALSTGDALMSRITLAADVDRALLGFQGAAFSAIEERGLTKEEAQAIEQAMGEWVDRVRRAHPDRTDLMTGRSLRAEREPGAGAAGGLGHLVHALGGELVVGPSYSAQVTALAEAAASSDLVVTTSTVFDWRVLEHSVVHTVTTTAAARAVPVVLLCDEVHVGRREQMSLGLQGAYSLQKPGWLRDPDASAPDVERALGKLATRVAGTWTPPPRTDVH